MIMHATGVMPLVVSSWAIVDFMVASQAHLEDTPAERLHETATKLRQHMQRLNSQLDAATQRDRGTQVPDCTILLLEQGFHETF